MCTVSDHKRDLKPVKERGYEAVEESAERGFHTITNRDKCRFEQSTSDLDADVTVLANPAGSSRAKTADWRSPTLGQNGNTLVPTPRSVTG